jgi:hypothetical protein
MRTAKKSTKNESSQSTQNNQQQKSFSNNLVILTGNLGADAAFFGINDSAASLRMATNTEFGDKKYVEWHSVVAFRELAKEVVEKCTKGRFIKVYGYLHNSKVVKDEVPQFRTEVIATKIKIPGSQELRQYLTLLAISCFAKGHRFDSACSAASIALGKKFFDGQVSNLEKRTDGDKCYSRDGKIGEPS